MSLGVRDRLETLTVQISERSNDDRRRRYETIRGQSYFSKNRSRAQVLAGCARTRRQRDARRYKIHIFQYDVAVVTVATTATTAATAATAAVVVVVPNAFGTVQGQRIVRLLLYNRGSLVGRTTDFEFSRANNITFGFLFCYFLCA